MHIVILDDIPFSIDIERMAEKLRIGSNVRHLNDLQRLIDQAHGVANPKALYRAAYIDSKGDDYVVVDGVRLTSRVLLVNLEHAQRVFPYVVTCGTELQEWAASLGDLVENYWAQMIQEEILRQARSVMTEHLDQHYHLGSASTMSPGRLEDWPMAEQRNLFALLGDTEKAIGVRLTDSLLMIPTKSVSGIRFPTEESFESCQLCPRERCPGRLAPYDQSLYESKYRLSSRKGAET